MRRPFRAVLALLALLGLLAAPLAGLSAADQAGDDGPGNWTIDDLRTNGRVVDDRYPSVRVATEDVSMWLVRYPPSTFNEYGTGEKEYLAADTTVRRNKIRLVASHPWDNRTRTYNLTVVYWRPDTREVETANGTTTERFANVTGVDRKQVRLDPGMQQFADLDLRGHYDESVRVTVWVNEYPDRLRWTFKHKSTKTAAPVDVDTKADLLSWAIVFVGLPSLVAVYLVGRIVPTIRRKALAGPGRSPGTWIAIPAILGTLMLIYGWLALSSLFVTLPLVIPLLVAFVAASILIEDDGDQVETWAFLRVDAEQASSPIDGESTVRDGAVMDVEEHKIVRNDDGEPCIYHKGLLAMWARYKGACSPLQIENQEAEWEGRGEYDRVVVVDDATDDVVTHEPPGIVFAWPWRTYSYDPSEDDDGGDGDGGDDGDGHHVRVAKDRLFPDSFGWQQLVNTLGVVAAVGVAAWTSLQAVGGSQLSAIYGPLAILPALAWYYARPVEGHSETRVAPGQARKAWTTAFYANINMRRFGTVEGLAEALIEAENKSLDVEEWIRTTRDEGLISRSHADSSPLDTVALEDDPAVNGGDDD